MSLLDDAIKLYDTVLIVGGRSNPFRMTTKSSDTDITYPVKYITFYPEGDYIRRIEITFKNGATASTGGGAQTRDARTFVFQDDEVLDECILYRVAYETGRVGIWFKTNFGRSFQIGNTSAPATQLDVKGSALYGLFGYSGAAIDGMGLIVNLPIVDINVSIVKYKPDGTSIVNKGVIGLDRITLSNNAGEDAQKVTVNRSFLSTTTSNWSITAGLKVGTKTNISAGIPFVVNGNVEVSAELSLSYTYGKTYTTTETFQYTAEASVPGGKQLYAIVTATQANLSISYDGIATVTYADGTTKDIGISGKYTGVTSYDVAVEYTTPEPPTEVVERRAKLLGSAA